MMKKRIANAMIFLVLFLGACAPSGEELQILTGDAQNGEGFPQETAEPETIRIAVYICGEVQNPGVYYLEEGSRVADLLDAANGALPDADLKRINLAQKLADGQQIIVEKKAENIEGTQTAASSGKVNINFAGKEELMTLPGIGESRAEAILSYREQAGWFSSTEDLMNITGIKEKMYEKIADLIEV